ncbi:alpha/beta fold hydrolase [Collinsella provencensis]|uniref:alpha/beta fold hydrolase n=1 Tax=Collinsella provencensis TaxID=1937461 RepID=UPI000C82D60D|nr:alpha/beta fold hydrolase [Collinsella provencensis]
MKTTTLTYPSRDGRSTVRALLWEPATVVAGSEAPRGLIQLVHGMAEHVERYAPFAAYLCEQGFAVCANDHVGHGKTVSSADELGHMPLEAGEDVLIADVHTLRKAALEVLAKQADMRPSNIPYIIFGHSMGSFIARVYITRHALGVRAAVLCGTGQQPRALTQAGKTLTRLFARTRGEHHVSTLVDGLGAGAYGKQIEDAQTEVDWISTDPEVVAEYQRDPLCGQPFTVGAYHTLLSLVSDATDVRLARGIPHGLPLLFIAGSDDPVGECGAGVDRAVEMYRKAGIERVDEKLYDGARHEILNEPIRDEVYADVNTWLAERGL